jgi:hypothetical protein
MSAIIQNNFRVSAARKFISQVGQSDNIVYSFIGKSTPWSNENSPDQPNDWAQSIIQAYDDMLYLKKIISNDVHLVIRRMDWERAYIYETYSHNKALFDDSMGVKPFYVVTDEMNVYKCIGNGFGKPSINKPTGRTSSIISTGDGYLWKYMFTVTSDLNKFVTPEFIPVKDTGSVGSTDYGIEYIEITNGGSGYTGSTIPLTVTGSGSGCLAYGKIVNGVITEVVITNKGSGYRNATAICAAPPAGGTQATFNPIISPPGGHGSNPPLELGGHFVMMIARFSRDENGKFTVNNDFRKIGLLENPRDYVTGGILSSDVLSMTQNLYLSSIVGTTFELDEDVIGSISGCTAKVIDYNTQTHVLRVANVSSEFYPGEQLRGVTSGTYGLLDIGSGSTGTCQSSGYTSVTLDATAPNNIAMDGFYTVIRITSGTGVGQIKVLDADSYDPNTKSVNILSYWKYGLLPDNTSTYTLAWIKYPDVQKDSGQLLYVEHRRPIIRSIDQIEEAKIVCEF